MKPKEPSPNKDRRDTCGVCGCSGRLENAWFMGMPAGERLFCDGYQLDWQLHERLDRKKQLLYERTLPASLLPELEKEIIEIKLQLQRMAHQVLLEKE